ncbi:polyprenyl diphosphate synthase [Streptomyces anulatus]|uniref:polyprenyl diphosphate synthase n=1 Tax=Streptomyces anulatus TaxID=1892 RepID=UPI0037DD8C0E|nr:polyprenyl diphosphate synthase [Streptomyces anulatus]
MTTTAARPLTDLPANLRATLPRHIAFIADGNRRWAADHGLTVEQGYEAGTAAVHDAIQQCRDLGGVQAVSVFIASERNFDRPPAHVEALVKVVCGLVRTAAANADGPVRVIGDLTRVPLPLIDAIEAAEAETAGRTGMSVCLGIGYDGQADIRRAVARALTAPHFNGTGEPQVDQFLSTAGLPELDLVVRTSGERRLSGFLLYQAADATMHFDDRLWPEWDDDALLQALAVHAAQTRKFGR